MHTYVPPLQDIRFVMHDLLGASDKLQAMSGYADCDADTLNSVAEEIGKFAAEVLHPLNAPGDAQGCQRASDGTVRTPSGFKSAFEAYAGGGWSGLGCDPKYGGQGLPTLLNTVLFEMLGATNLAWAGYPGLSHAAYACIEHSGSDDQKLQYLPPLATGKWTGTMCLTEAHCGSDLGLLKTRAVPEASGGYALSGAKIFISGGEHDLTENIVHLVLARIDGAPERTKGISLFVVPKYLPGPNGELGARNSIHCGSLEHKMGIRGNATCELVLDGARGWLVGQPNTGLQAMFVMMNAARVGVGIQAVGITDYVYQCSRHYAFERLQFRAPSGPTRPELPADPIVVHPDVRRMLLTQKAYAEGGRALAYWTALLLDEEACHPDEHKRREAGKLAALLTPVVKAFLSDNACECANHAVQIHGGHGYISETGVEQYVRDARITPIYEGTNGIQALDLLARKVVGDKGQTLLHYLDVVQTSTVDAGSVPEISAMAGKLKSLVQGIRRVATGFTEAERPDPDAVAIAANHFLRLLGHVTFGFLWLRMARLALQQSKEDQGHLDFLAAKVSTARFYFERLLPEVEMHFAALSATPDSVMVPLSHLN